MPKERAVSLFSQEASIAAEETTYNAHLALMKVHI